MPTELPHQIDSAQLTHAVRQMLNHSTAEITHWQATPLSSDAGNPTSAGIFRIAGTAEGEGAPLAWSLILKIFQSPANLGLENLGEGDDPTHWNYWRREFHVFQSGWLNNLPTGLAAPQCYAAYELPNAMGTLWLEDIQESYGQQWSLAQYANIARQLGRLNGLHLAEHDQPLQPWFSRRILRQWATTLPQLTSLPWEHPHVLTRYPPPAENPFRQLLAEHQMFLDLLDRLPQTVGHGDTYPTNFMLRRLPNGSDQTVALDWALMGVQALGEDLGQFTYGAHMQLPNLPHQHITETLFEAYMAGLSDSGCHTDPQWVRFGAAVAGALRVGMYNVHLIQQSLEQNSTAVDETAPTPARDCFEVLMARTAFDLLKAGLPNWPPHA